MSGDWEELERLLREEQDLESREPDFSGASEGPSWDGGMFDLMWLPPGVFVQFVESPPPSSPPAEETKKTEAEEEAAEGWLLPWWVLGLLLFGFGDTFTSIMVFNRGGVEANPLFTFLMRLVGNNISSFVLVKTAILVFLVLVTYIGLPPRSRWVIPLILIGVGSLLTVRNFLILLSL